MFMAVAVTRVLSGTCRLLWSSGRRIQVAHFLGCMRSPLKTEHGPLSQAILHVFDVFHSLARRGQNVSALPVVVLAGRAPLPSCKSASQLSKTLTKKKQVTFRNRFLRQKKTTGTDREGPTVGDGDYQRHGATPAVLEPSRLRCMEASLYIPEKIANGFWFNVTRCVQFSEETDRLAIAIYLNAMTIGLRYANGICSRDVRVPTSLCCRALHLANLQLVSSPIPGALVTDKLTISQGELFTLHASADTLLKTLLTDFNSNSNVSRALLLVEPSSATQRFIVKVSCRPVHNTLIRPEHSWDALKKFHKVDISLKTEISKVLVACACFEGSGTIATVMKDLRLAENGNFQVLRHSSFPRTLPLWDAFSVFVENVLLPLAGMGIVHMDIRFSPPDNTTYNILGRHRDCGPGPSIELRLIDWESCAIFSRIGHMSPTYQPYAMASTHFMASKDLPPAYEFVFWQVCGWPTRGALGRKTTKLSVRLHWSKAFSPLQKNLRPLGNG
jgi:hypothetical protein